MKFTILLTFAGVIASPIGIGTLGTHDPARDVPLHELVVPTRDVPLKRNGGGVGPKVSVRPSSDVSI
jgi:hypothetical protein